MKRSAAALGLGAVAVAAVAAASLFACRQIVNFRDAPSPAQPAAEAGTDAGSETAVACGFGYGTSACASCVTAHCCDESNACEVDAVCKPYAACAAACAGDPACRAQCGLDSPPGSATELPALNACLVKKCENECGLTCGALTSARVYGGVPPDAAAACQSCIRNQGCAQARACGGSVDCEGVLLCATSCTAMDCQVTACDANDAGETLALALSPFTRGTCAGPCADGADWSCVGRVGWTRPKSASVKMTILVEDLNTLATFPGVHVSVCDRTDVGCHLPKTDGFTDQTGTVVLEFPNPVGENYGLDGYLQVKDETDASPSSAVVPWLFYWGFPLSEPEFAVKVGVVTLDKLRSQAESLGFPYDPAKSLLVATAFDCDGHPAAGVQMKTNPSILTPFVYGLSASDTSTNRMYGFATLAGLPPGSVDVIATPLALGKPSSRQTVVLRPGWVTAPIMLPTLMTP